MADRLPQDTPVLWKRLHRAAKRLREPGSLLDGSHLHHVERYEVLRAFANTCDQAAGRLRQYYHEYGEAPDAIEMRADTVVEVE